MKERRFRRFRRALLTLSVAGVLTGAVAAASVSSPALAFGNPSWQITFAGSATFPSAGFVTLKLTSKAKFSGSAYVAGQKVSIVGAFGQDGIGHLTAPGFCSTRRSRA